MLEWGIPVPQWYGMSRAARVKSVTIVIARKLINYCLSGGE